ncbi:PREDICTED: kynurenine--oxoglutarate transaminase 1, mitochondrial-like [Priapulus caudatus]|uniref:kynurenine--oxoglutarate transaminase n=1 Tax=Priapulus caudatus TaxID=37621 RepID=A0ABM1F4D5_PRICU|nr:PREDICTED: kynurenine--oxoglutarate transaminase 1, mitochondrial-like [Priapulus caudatus]
MKQALSDTVLSDDAMLHQYAPYFGHARLVRAIATMYSPLHGRRLNADNITVTCGAFCALSACITACEDPGDEVLVVEPYYDEMTHMAGGTPIFVPMRPQKQQQQQGGETATTSGDWKIDADELERCCGPKTKMLILNSPNNHVGKVFDGDELRMLADVARRRDLVVVSDEVYEWLTFDTRSHVRVAGHVATHAQHQQQRQDVQRDGVEDGGLGHRLQHLHGSCQVGAWNLYWYRSHSSSGSDCYWVGARADEVE